MKDLKVYVKECMEYKLSEWRDAEKTIGRYIVYINEAFEYLNINTLDDLNSIKYPTIKINWDIGVTNKDDKIRIVGNIYESKDLIEDMDNY